MVPDPETDMAVEGTVLRGGPLNRTLRGPSLAVQNRGPLPPWTSTDKVDSGNGGPPSRSGEGSPLSVLLQPRRMTRADIPEVRTRPGGAGRRVVDSFEDMSDVPGKNHSGVGRKGLSYGRLFLNEMVDRS